jgi:hypothetical protein
MQERSHSRTFIIIRHCGRKYNAGKYQSNIVEYQGITAKVRNGLAPQRLRVTADIYSHALRGRDQEAARRWDNFMRLHGGREEPSGVN